MENPIEVKNAEITLTSVRSDLVRASKELSTVYEEKAAVEKDLVKAKEELQMTKTCGEGVLKEIASQKEDLKISAVAAEKMVERSKEELRVVKKQVSEAMSELRRINDWILTAEDSKKVLEERLVKIHELELKKQSHVSDIENFRIKREVAESEYASIVLDAKLVSDNAKEEVRKCDEAVLKSKEALESLQHEIELEKIKLSDTIQERVRISKDLEVCILRVEEKYNEAFPELRMKI